MFGTVGKIAKKPRRALRRQVRNLRDTIARGAPAWASDTFGPLVQYADMLLVDHGVFRLFYQNRHALAQRAWRSAQPAPHQIRHLAGMGIRTIVNLRGARSCGSYWLEREACARSGIRLESFPVRSRAAPTREEIFEACALFGRIEYPMLMHCKSGADRVGLMSALYLIAREKTPVEAAKAQLSLRYGHVRQADTGVLDHFFESYLKHRAQNPIDFFDWVAQVYDPGEVRRSFAASKWANVMVNRILRRE